MKSSNKSLPTIYLDSDALIKGAIESLPSLAVHPHLQGQQAAMLSEIPHAKELLERWNPKSLYVSMHTLMETLNCATRTYGMTLEEAGTGLAEACGRDFTILFGKFELTGTRGDLVQKFENRIPDSAIYSSSYLHGQAFGPNRERIGPIAQGGSLASGGFFVPDRSGNPEVLKEAVTIGRVDSHWISSPKLERELFLRAIQLSQDSGLLP